MLCVLSELQDWCAISRSATALSMSLLLPADIQPTTGGLRSAAILYSTSTTSFVHTLLPTASCCQLWTGSAIGRRTTSSSLSPALWCTSLTASAASSWRRKCSFYVVAVQYLSRCSSDRHNVLQWLARHIRSSGELPTAIPCCQWLGVCYSSWNHSRCRQPHGHFTWYIGFSISGQ